MAQLPPQKLTVEEYLAYEDADGVKYEYIDGEIYAMSGGTRKHSQLIMIVAKKPISIGVCLPYKSIS